MRESQPKIIIIGSIDGAMENLSRKLHDADFTNLERQPISKINARKGNGAHIAIFLPRIAREYRTEAAQKLRKANPGLKIVMLYDHTISGTEVADAVINANCETEDLARVVAYLTRKGTQEKAQGV